MPVPQRSSRWLSASIPPHLPSCLANWPFAGLVRLATPYTGSSGPPGNLLLLSLLTFICTRLVNRAPALGQILRRRGQKEKEIEKQTFERRQQKLRLITVTRSSPAARYCCGPPPSLLRYPPGLALSRPFARALLTFSSSRSATLSTTTKSPEAAWHGYLGEQQVPVTPTGRLCLCFDRFMVVLLIGFWATGLVDTPS